MRELGQLRAQYDMLALKHEGPTGGAVDVDRLGAPCYCKRLQLQAVAPVADANSVRRIVSAGLGLPREPCTELAAHTGAVQAQAQRRADPELDDTTLTLAQEPASNPEHIRAASPRPRAGSRHAAYGPSSMPRNEQTW